MAGVIQMIGDGKIPAPTVNRSPANKLLLEKAAQYNPNFNSAMNKTSAAEQIDATSGPQGDQINALNTTMSHMDKLRQTVADLNNGTSPVVNEAKNLYAQQVGGQSQIDRQQKLATLETELNAVRREASKVYAPGGGTVSDVEDWKGAFPIAGSRQAQEASLAKLAGMLEDKGNQIGEQYKSGVGSTTGAPPLQIFSPQTRQLMNTMKALGPDQGVAPPSAQPTPKMISQLKMAGKDPKAIAAFEKYYGAGSAARYIGGQ